MVSLVEDKNSIDNEIGHGSSEATKSMLIQPEPIHHHILPPNEPHPCDKLGCPREAKYQLANSYYCDDKAVSHFREIAKNCQEENFELIEDLQQLDIQYSISGVIMAIFVPCCVWLGEFLFDSNLRKVIQNIGF